MFVKELIDSKASVNLFTRPRRFGKTLALSMLQYYFEDAYDRRGNHVEHGELFDGLLISQAGEQYTKHMGQYPVISLTLKSRKQATFEIGCMVALRTNLADKFTRHSFIEMPR